MLDMSAPILVWMCAGEPTATRLVSRASGDRQALPIRAIKGHCATCGMAIRGGTPVAEVENETFSRHSEFLRWGNHVCRACAWLYADPKQHHRAFLAVQGRPLLWPVLGADSATADRPLWLRALTALADDPDLSPDTPVAVLMTTDPKPRLWPLVQLATLRRFGAYVHCPDYDISAWVDFDLRRALDIAGLVARAMGLDYSKRAIRSGLLSDLTRASKNMAAAMSLELELSAARADPAFIPGLLMAQAPAPIAKPTSPPPPPAAIMPAVIQGSLF